MIRINARSAIGLLIAIFLCATCAIAQDDLKGTWKMVANDQYNFDLSLTQSRNDISGTMTRTNGDEPVDTISGIVANDEINFTRIRPGSFVQEYEGKITGNGDYRHMEGTFKNRQYPEYQWRAENPQSQDGTTKTWMMVANNHEFTLTYTQNGISISGTMTQPNGNEPESTISGSLLEDTGEIQFIRDMPGPFYQSYIGHIGGGGVYPIIQGTFTEVEKTTYHWKADFFAAPGCSDCSKQECQSGCIDNCADLVGQQRGDCIRACQGISTCSNCCNP